MLYSGGDYRILFISFLTPVSTGSSSEGQRIVLSATKYLLIFGGSPS